MSQRTLKPGDRVETCGMAGANYNGHKATVVGPYPANYSGEAVYVRFDSTEVPWTLDSENKVAILSKYLRVIDHEGPEIYEEWFA